MKNLTQKVQRLGVASLLTILLVMLFGKLSLWQWHRYHIKQNLQMLYQTQSHAVPERIEDYLKRINKEKEGVVFHHVILRGHYLTTQYLLDNQTHQGRIGFNVITPFQLESGQIILVNRGFIPASIHRQITASIALDTKPLTISGLLTIPSHAFVLGEILEKDNGNGPKKIMRVDPVILAKDLQRPVAPYIFLLDPSNSSGFYREWALPNLWAERSLGYCFQWLALALLTMVLYLVVVNRILKEKTHAEK